VISTHTETITKTIDGTEVTRHGDQENKALFIKQEDGTKVLKLNSEVRRAH